MAACEAGGAACAAHEAKKERRDAEARLVASALSKAEAAKRAAAGIFVPGAAKRKAHGGGDSNGAAGGGPGVGGGIPGQAKKIKPGTFCEDAFESLGDTVVVWSLARYLANGQWSGDHLEAQRRSLRGGAGGGSRAGAGSPPPGLQVSRRARRVAKRRAAHSHLADLVKALVQAGKS